MSSLALEDRLERLLACRRVAAQQYNGAGPWHEDNPRYLAQELVDWATADGQTPELVGRAVQELDSVELTRRQPAGRLLNEYLLVREILRGDRTPSFLAEGGRPTAEQWLAYSAHEMVPGERARSERALEILASASAHYLSEIADFLFAAGASEQAAAHWREGLQRSYFSPSWSAMLARMGPDGGRANERELVRQTDLIVNAQTSYFAASEFGGRWGLPRYIEQWTQAFAWRRAERVRLALIAYRLREGDYPESLDQLTPDYLSAEAIRDPYAAAPFGYAPQGFDPRVWVDGFATGRLELDSEAGTPMLWCIGSGEAQPTVKRLFAQVAADGHRTERAVDTSQELDGDWVDEGLVNALRRQAPNVVGGRPFWMPLPR